MYVPVKDFQFLSHIHIIILRGVNISLMAIDKANSNSFRTVIYIVFLFPVAVMVKMLGLCWLECEKCSEVMLMHELNSNMSFGQNLLHWHVMFFIGT